MLMLLEMNFFGVYLGARQHRFTMQLQQAFARFKLYCKHHKIKHSQSCFTTGMLNCDNPWLEFRGKAANTRHVVQWMYLELVDAAGPELLLALFGALSHCLRFMHTATTTLFDPSCAGAFIRAGRVALLANSDLSKQAHEAGLPRWPLRPKHHQFHHVPVRVQHTGKVPAWCFSDEDFNGKIIKTNRPAQQRTVAEQVARKWQLRLWCTLG